MSKFPRSGGHPKSVYVDDVTRGLMQSSLTRGMPPLMASSIYLMWMKKFLRTTIGFWWISGFQFLRAPPFLLLMFASSFRCCHRWRLGFHKPSVLLVNNPTIFDRFFSGHCPFINLLLAVPCACKGRNNFGIWRDSSMASHQMQPYPARVFRAPWHVLTRVVTCSYYSCHGDSWEAQEQVRTYQCMYIVTSLYIYIYKYFPYLPIYLSI